jgi:transcriptional regulator with XRE-family HTH domain
MTRMPTPLRTAREKRRDSTRTVADAVGINQSQYSRVESGLRRPSPDLANRLAKYFGNAVTRDQILFPEDYAEQPARKPIRAKLQKAS